MTERQTLDSSFECLWAPNGFRQRPKFAAALKQCLKMQDAHLAETQQSLRPIRPEHQQRQRQDQQFEGGENFGCYVNRKTGWRYYTEPRRNLLAASPSPTSQWQLHNGKRVDAHGSLHHLRSGGDFGFLERIPENRRGVDRTPTHNTHLCSTVFSQTRNAHDALGSRLKGQHGSRIALSSLCA